jgi:hypothetical protein
MAMFPFIETDLFQFEFSCTKIGLLKDKFTFNKREKIISGLKRSESILRPFHMIFHKMDLPQRTRIK